VASSASASIWSRVPLDKVKFVNEPIVYHRCPQMRLQAARVALGRRQTTTGWRPAAPAPEAESLVSGSRRFHSARTKDQLKAMSEFKYSIN